MAQYSKFIAAIVAVIAEAVSLGLLPDSINKVVALVLAVLGALGVYVVPNALTARQRALVARSGITMPQA